MQDAGAYACAGIIELWNLDPPLRDENPALPTLVHSESLVALYLKLITIYKMNNLNHNINALVHCLLF